MSKKSQEHPYIPALNGEVLRTKHDKVENAGNSYICYSETLIPMRLICQNRINILSQKKY